MTTLDGCIPVPRPIARWRFPLAVLAAASMLVAPLRGQNLVANGEFDADVATWEALDSESLLLWDTPDHTGCGAASGSALAANGDSVANRTQAFVTCVQGIVAGETYSFGVDLRFPSGQATTGWAEMGLGWYSGTSCSGEFLGGEQSDPEIDSAATGWQATRNEAVVAPAGAQSVQVRIVVLKAETGDVLLARFDGAYLAAGGSFLFADGVESGSLCHWSATSP